MLINKGLINKILLILTFLLIPTNLAYHFVLTSSYVSGVLINFLQPTIYLQDILIWIFILINVSALDKAFIKENKFLFWFVFVLMLSVFSSLSSLLSLSYFFRIYGIVLFAIIAKEINTKDELLRTLRFALSIAVICISLLGIFQWFIQRSVFNNYLVFGEQPYHPGTPGITRENFFGKAKIPPYSTFMHPNTFAGFLVISLFLLLPEIKSKTIKIAIIFGVVALFLTWSKVAWLAFVVSLAFYLLKSDKSKKIVFLSVLLLGLSALVLPILPLESSNPSIYRRVDLLDSSYRLIKNRYLFGYGLGVTPKLIDRHFPLRHDVGFIHPPHNIFVLMILESGFVALSLFIMIVAAKRDKTNSYYLLVLQVIILGSFDHYLITMPQTQILLWFALLFL